MKARLSLVAWVCILGCASVPLAFAQNAEITGRVTDQTGAAVPGAAITVINVANSQTRATVSNEQGYYVLPLLQPGTYNIKLEKTGFKVLSQSGLKLDVAQTARMDFSLELGQVTESVNVEATAPLLEAERGAVGQVIGNQKIVDLPLNGRNFTQLATLVPGAITQATSGFMNTPNITVNGGRLSTMVYMVDGMNSNEQYWNGAMVTPSVDAIQEFKVQSNAFSAEYGQGNAIINLQLRSGTNDFHGSAFEFLRNDALDARNFFAVGPKPAIKQNQFGGTFGGPVTIPKLVRGRDAHFFFVDYQGTRISRGRTFNSLTATEAMRAGNFAGLPPLRDPATTRPDPNRPGSFITDVFPNNLIPSNRLSPQALYFLPYIPLPNAPGGTTFAFSPAAKTNKDQFDVKMDHRLGASDMLQYSYSFQQETASTPASTPLSGAIYQDLRTQSMRVSEIHTFSPHFMNQFRAGHVRNRSFSSPQGLGENHTVKSGISGFAETSLRAPGFPNLAISNYLGVNATTFYPINHSGTLYNVSDNLIISRGKHLINTGVEVRSFPFEQFNAAYSRGAFSFNGNYTGDAFADFMLGIPFQGSRAFPRNPWGVGPDKNVYMYIQDDWKVLPNLTLNIGLRYELNFRPNLKNNTIASFDPSTGKLVVATDDDGKINTTAQGVTKYVLPLYQDIVVTDKSVGLPNSLRRTDHNDFAPRFGFAWMLPRDTVVRGGYGIFYTLQQANRMGSTAIGSVPFLADELSNFNTTPAPTKTLANMFPELSLNNFVLTPPNVFRLDPNSRSPYLQQWNLTVQHVVKKRVSLEAAYVASKGSKLDFSRPFNVPLPGPGTIQPRRPLQRFGVGSIVESSSYSSYNALQAKAEIRTWRGLSMLASYAYAKSLDNQSGDPQGGTFVMDPNNLRLEKGPSSFDVRQRFVTSFNYALPALVRKGGVARQLLNGWEIGSIFTAQAGFPFTPTVATDVANIGLPNRPDRIGDGRLDDRTLNRDFDVAAFRPAAPFTFGNGGRSILNGRGFVNWDLLTVKNFRVKERMNIQFRAEFFNFTNTPAFGLPTSNIQSSLAGRVLSAGEPRDIQFALKLNF